MQILSKELYKHEGQIARADILFLFFYFFVYLFIYLFCFLEPNWGHMEVPRIGGQVELQLLDYTTTIATWDLSHACNLHHSSRQLQILNPLSKARDRTHILIDTSLTCGH